MTNITQRRSNARLRAFPLARAARLALLADDVEFRNPIAWAEWRQPLLECQRRDGVFVEQDGAERQVGQRVAVPVLMRMADGTELRAAGIFEFAEGKVALFQVVMDRTAAGLGAGPSRDDAEPPAR